MSIDLKNIYNEFNLLGKEKKDLEEMVNKGMKDLSKKWDKAGVSESNPIEGYYLIEVGKFPNYKYLRIRINLALKEKMVTAIVGATKSTKQEYQERKLLNQ